MSARHRKRGSRQGGHRLQPRLTNGMPDLPGVGTAPWIAEAMKTYLQENVALLRPQVSSTEMAHLWRFGVSVWSAASYRAEALRQVDFVMADANGIAIPSELDPTIAMINRALKRNMRSIIERSEVSYCFYGQVLWRKVRSPVTRVVDKFQWINNNFFQLDDDHWEGLRGFRIRAVWGSDLDPDLDYIPVEESVYMHNIDFFEDFGGLGPAEVCYVQAATETEISATQLQFFRNMAMPAFVMQPAEGNGFRPGPDQKDEMTKLMRSMYQGAANAGRTAILPTRWEMLKLQQDFDKLGMPQLSAKAEDAVVRVMRVPLELMDPRQVTSKTGTKFYDQKREWLISWLVPQAQRYGDELTEQLAVPLNPDWQIIPAFTRVDGLDEDISSRTDTVRKQVADTLVDLYRAQKILGVKPDKNLKGLYMVQGVPVPSAQMQDYWRFAPGNPGKVSAEDMGNTRPQSPQTLPTQNTGRTPNAGDDSNIKSVPVIPFLPDAQYREMKTWRVVIERKGKDYAFEGKSLPSHAVAFGRLLLSTDTPTDETWNAIRVQAVKSYDDTENRYRTSLYELMTDAMNGTLDRNQFGIAGRSEIDFAFLNGFKNGLQQAGVDPSEMDDDEKQVVALEAKAERSYWTALANDMYRRVIPLKDTPEFAAARDAMLGRIEMWINKGLYRMAQLGNMYGKGNQMKRFKLGGTKDHCRTCSAADGQVHRSRVWLKANIYPRSDSCICTGINCDCAFEDTTDPASGSLLNIPIAGGAKSHEHVEHNEHVELEVAV